MNTFMVYNPTVGIEEDNVSDAGAHVGRVRKGGYLISRINMDIPANTSPTGMIILILESSELMGMNKLEI